MCTRKYMRTYVGVKTHTWRQIYTKLPYQLFSLSFQFFADINKQRIKNKKLQITFSKVQFFKLKKINTAYDLLFLYFYK